MTVEFIFAVVTAVITSIAGVFTKDNVIPSRFIPIQNLVIGIVAAIISVILGLFDNYLVAILVSLGMSFGAGGAYDLVSTIKKK